MEYDRQTLLLLREYARDKKSVMKLYSTGDCMRPCIRPGDVLLVRDVAAKDLRLGDIVVFENQSDLFCHRFISKRPQENRLILETKADVYSVKDKSFFADNLLGKVIGIQRQGKSLILDSFGWIIINRLLGVYHKTICWLRNLLHAGA